MRQSRARRAHPRSRGENSEISSRTIAMSGSSPLTRGKPAFLRSSFGLRGLIPAHAGKTQVGPQHWSRCWAHPRSRGENVFVSERRRASRGSSPLTRGKPDSSAGPRRGRGLIPAHAAKTTLPQPRAGTPRAHPRSRGENSSSARPGDLVCGSSPLTRGKQPVNNDPIVVIGLIPAHAGKTEARTKRPLAAGAHPRSPGANTASAACCGTTPGSSPLTRGKRRRRALPVVEAGLIPAHAGKTSGPLSHIR